MEWVVMKLMLDQVTRPNVAGPRLATPYVGSTTSQRSTTGVPRPSSDRMNRICRMGYEAGGAQMQCGWLGFGA
jgi:hypothetical protein